jgi:hypothetical protein
VACRRVVDGAVTVAAARANGVDDGRGARTSGAGACRSAAP